MRPSFVSEEMLQIMQEKVRSGVHPKPSRLAERRASASSPPFAPFQLAIVGQLPSGKNQVQLTWRNGKVHRYPNKTFTKWRAAAMAQIAPELIYPPLIKQPISLTCNYWPGDHRTRDVSGQLDAIFSLLVYAKVLKDDGLIWSVLWRRHDVNQQFPKVVMELEAWHP